MQASSEYLELRVAVPLGGVAVLLGNVRLVGCRLDPPSQAQARLSMRWEGLPAPREYISHYEWAVVTAPAPLPQVITVKFS